jgi:uncharacterized protein
MNPFQQHGAFSWCELMTSDPKAAQAFYGEIFGWDMKDGPIGDIDYTVVSAGGEQIGGITGIPAGAPNMPPSWGTYVTVDNVELTVKKAAALGGKVLMEPREIPDVGQFALIQDPQGAILSVISYGQSEPASA